jgi:phage shock protein A
MSEPYTIEEERAAWQAKLDEANAEVERLRAKLQNYDNQFSSMSVVFNGKDASNYGTFANMVAIEVEKLRIDKDADSTIKRNLWDQVESLQTEVERLRSRLAICKELFDYEEKCNGITIGKRQIGKQNRLYELAKEACK